MAYRVIVDANSELNRFRAKGVVGLPGHTSRSIQGLAFDILMRQEGRDQLANEISNKSGLQRNPFSIAPHAESKGYTPSAKWVFNLHSIYKDIVLHEASVPGSAIRRSFESIRSEANGRSCQFIVCSGSKELVYSSGLRPWEIDSAPRLPGYNIFGSILQDGYEQFLENSFEPRWGLGALSPEAAPVTLPDLPQKTVLLISDSQSKFVQSIEGGDYVSIRGGIYEDLSGAVYLRDFDVRNYAYVIVNCGVNVARLPFADQQSSWNILMDRLSRLETAAEKRRVLVSTAIPHPRAEGVQQHSQWIKEQATAAGFKCINWSTRQPSPFVIDGHINTDMFEDWDGFHLSHNGFRELWLAWASYLPNLRYVGYTMGPKTGPGYMANKWIPRAHARD